MSQVRRGLLGGLDGNDRLVAIHSAVVPGVPGIHEQARDREQERDGDDGRDDLGDRVVPPEHDGGDEDDGVARARAGHAGLVLKPQREGGGNNVYKDAIPAFLDALPRAEREAWIAMELIRAPEGLGNYLVRAGGGNAGAVRAEVISELGIFGWALFGGEDGAVTEKEVGWLVRTKGKDSNEGGVAAGFSVLDSIVLVD